MHKSGEKTDEETCLKKTKKHQEILKNSIKKYLNTKNNEIILWLKVVRHVFGFEA